MPDSGCEVCSMLGGSLSDESRIPPSECQTESIKIHDNGSINSNSSNAANPSAGVPNLLAWVLDNMDDEELHDAFRSIFQGDACVLDRQWLQGQVLFGLQNLSKIYNVTGSAECRLRSSENEDKAIPTPGSDFCERVHSVSTDVQDRDTLMVNGGGEVECPQCDTSHVERVQLQHSVPSSTVAGNAVISNDRETLMANRGSEGDGRLGKHSVGDISDVQDIRPQLVPSISTMEGTAFMSNDTSGTPPSRDIEEILVKSGSRGKRLEKPVITSRDKFVHDRLGRQHLHKVDPSQVYQEGHIRRAHPRTVTAIARSESRSVDDMLYGAAEQTNNKKVRRMHHRQWTLPEVENLVNGVSLYGVGQWSKIKTELFPTSTFRTSVDLKDKWRNLVNASMVHLRNKHKGAVYNFPVPKSQLERVKELSILHPYPRVQKTRFMSVGSSTSVASGTYTANCMDGAASR